MLALALALAQVPGPEPLLELRGSAPNDCFGVSVAGGGDANGDGTPDVIVGQFDYTRLIPHYVPKDAGPATVGVVRVYSGRDGDLLRELRGETSEHGFGLDVAFAGDTDGDGRADVLVAAPLWSFAASLGMKAAKPGGALLFSGEDAKVLARCDGPTGRGVHGMSVCAVGDRDGDRHDDYAAAHGWMEPGLDTSFVLVHSGRDGGILQRLECGANDGVMPSLADAGDLDGDGTSDLVVGAAGADVGGVRDCGRVFVFSGKTGAVLHEWNGAVAFADLGSSVAGLGDVDGDGRADVLVGSTGVSMDGQNAGRAEVRSGRDGSVLLAFEGASDGAELGRDACALGDVDGDRVPDFALAGWSVGRPQRGHTRVHSGRDGALLFECPGESVASAGDLDGDGRAELVAAERRRDEPGVVRVYSVAKALRKPAEGAAPVR